MLNYEVIVVEYFHSEYIYIYMYIYIYISIVGREKSFFDVRIILNMHYYQLTLS